jgi:hypothetical protein
MVDISFLPELSDRYTRLYEDNDYIYAFNQDGEGQGVWRKISAEEDEQPLSANTHILHLAKTRTHPIFAARRAAKIGVLGSGARCENRKKPSLIESLLNGLRNITQAMSLS